MGSVKPILMLLQAFYGLSMGTTQIHKANVVSKDAIPNSGDFTVIKTDSVPQCLIACQHAEGCQSFVTNTGKSECRLYSINSTVISSATGYAYYAFSGTPNAPLPINVASNASVATTQSTTAAGPRKEVRFEIYDKANLTFDDANANCKNISPDGRLACILTADEQEKINSLIKGIKGCPDIWVGLEKMDDSWDKFRWLDGTVINYSEQGNHYHNWMSFYPMKMYKTAANVKVLLMTPIAGQWAETLGDQLYCSVCEFPVQ